ncbi:10841_t:CDS:2, partial [Ambispora leptoticha]
RRMPSTALQRELIDRRTTTSDASSSTDITTQLQIPSPPVPPLIPATAPSPIILYSHPPPPNILYNSAASSQRVDLKTSITHPINVSWILPEELLGGLSIEPLPPSLDLFDVYTSASLCERYNTFRSNSGISTSQTQQMINNQNRNVTTATDINSSSTTENNSSSNNNLTRRLLGNLALSSCPGKKVRLTGPVRGRATINRDLDLDFQRLKTLGISVIVCCLDDEELKFLGAPWAQYKELAQHHNLEIIRLPMVEGGCPDSVEQLEDIITKLDNHIENERRVLAHCRGGVGRAGLIACCWLLKRRYCHSAERSIQMVRMRRSPKAIETMQQVDFIMQYANYIDWTRRQQQQSPQQQQESS